jgi:DNA-binding CsgD family transcriptional regulator
LPEAPLSGDRLTDGLHFKAGEKRSEKNVAHEVAPSWAPSPQLLQVLEQLGTQGFYDAFLQWLHDEFGAEQCMVFFSLDGQKVSTLLYKDYAREASARKLAETYIGERHYLQDPNFNILKAIKPGDVQVVRLDSVSSNMGLHYRKAFFESPGFLDKLAIIRGSESGNYYINLYRRSSRFDSRFDCTEFTTNLGALISVLLCKHFALNEQLRLEGALAFLSDREQQVCRAVLRGKKNEAIAAELDVAVSSIITYRKRAYEKLGISSRAQLFALCS